MNAAKRRMGGTVKLCANPTTSYHVGQWILNRDLLGVREKPGLRVDLPTHWPETREALEVKAEG